MSAPVDVLAVMDRECDFIVTANIIMKRGKIRQVHFRASNYPSQKITAEWVGRQARSIVDRWLVIDVTIAHVNPVNDAARAAVAAVSPK